MQEKKEVKEEKKRERRRHTSQSLKVGSAVTNCVMLPKLISGSKLQFESLLHVKTSVEKRPSGQSVVLVPPSYVIVNPVPSSSRETYEWFDSCNG